ncbi:MAG: DNA gyrase subunit A [Acidimicrobiia bacterium]|nr:DNA gyrase subunit A [Acidimicrobiia bacterium]
MTDVTRSPDGAPEEPNITPIDIEEEMKNSFMEYSMSVIVSRALPDVRDGLKPVQRRILYGMFEQGIRPDRPRQKSATAVGHVMGRYHPHGDQTIYDALVRMAQDFNLSHTLIDPKGNFGSIDFPAAAMRYTEARLSPLALHLLDGINEETVDFIPNYDSQHSEPMVLPARFPNLLVNGSAGIAVGMATNIPPHDLGEVCDAVVHYLDHPDATPDDLMQFVTGPDFPTGAEIVGREGIRSAYRTGRGSIRMRAKCEIVESSARKTQIVVTEFPYQVSLQRTAERIAQLVRDGKLEGVSNVADHSDKDGPRLVVELKVGVVPQVVLNNLYKHTALQDTFGANMVALVDGVPRTLNLAELVGHYVDHQIDVIQRRSRFRLDRARERAHIVEGLLIALDDIDRVIAIIRGSDDTDTARARLINEVGVSEVQANHILDMQLRRLTSLETQKLRDELTELHATITDLEAILADPARQREVVRVELCELRDKHARGRRSEIVPDDGEFDIEDLIADEDLVISITAGNYVKAVLASEYRTQQRGGKGVKGAALREDDEVAHLLTTTAHAYLLLFSNRGKVYRIKAHKLRPKDRTARGEALVQFLPLAADERIQAVIDTRDYETARYLVMVTRHGVVKKTRFREYDVSRQDGIIAIRLRDGDALERVFTTSGEDHVLVVTREGMGIRFAETDVRPMGRNAAGVKAISLAGDDVVIHADVARPGSDVLCVTSGGFGKRTSCEDFRPQRRGGKGLVAMKLPAGRGDLVAAPVVAPDEIVMLINSSGVMIRQNVADVSRQGRSATGVKMAALSEGEQITAVATGAAATDLADDEES